MIQHSRSSLYAYYADALESGRNTGENLQAPTSGRFNSFLEMLPAKVPRTALDLGYGAGAYTIALARAGFKVTAVDQVPNKLLLRSLKNHSELASRIAAEECLIERYPVADNFGVVVAKDVLHYLSREDAERVLSHAVHKSVPHSVHYLEVFTGIRRTAANGESIHIEGEAGYTPESFTDTVESIYRDWELTLLWDEHTERDTRSGHSYFEARRATVVAKRQGAASAVCSGTGE